MCELFCCYCISISIGILVLAKNSLIAVLMGDNVDACFLLKNSRSCCFVDGKMFL